MGVPLNIWFIRENPSINGWFRGTPICGNLKIGGSIIKLAISPVMMNPVTWMTTGAPTCGVNCHIIRCGSLWWEFSTTPPSCRDVQWSNSLQLAVSYCHGPWKTRRIGPLHCGKPILLFRCVDLSDSAPPFNYCWCVAQPSIIVWEWVKPC